MTNLRYFLPAYFVIYVLVAFVWRSYLVWKRTGINPVTFKGSDTAYDFIGRVCKFIFVVSLSLFSYSFSPVSYAYTSPIQWLDHRWLRSIGVLRLLLSLIWIFVAISDGISLVRRNSPQSIERNWCKMSLQHLTHPHIPGNDAHAGACF